mmetsp:Transcript_56815/g.123670  ORF Transcript_56815/g.123670 Transcript_56815/m.123670 type:complete len:219 (-) Transcript_56815:1804-2460(-)
MFNISNFGVVSSTQHDRACGNNILHGHHFFLDSILVAFLLLAFLVLEVVLFDHVEFGGESLHFVFVLVDLGLVHIDFGRHALELLVLLPQRSLHGVHALDVDVPAALHDVVLQLPLHLLLLVEFEFLLHHFFGLGDKAFLQVLDFLEEFVSFGIGAFESAPSVDVLRVLELFTQRFDFDLLLQQLLLEVVHLLLERPDALVLLVADFLLSFEILDHEL